MLILLPLPTFSTEASDQNSGILQMRMKNGDTIVHAYELYKIVAKKKELNKKLFHETLNHTYFLLSSKKKKKMLYPTPQ